MNGVLHGHASHSEAATADCCLSTFASSPAAFAEIQASRLRTCGKILREQTRQCDAGNAKWPDNFRALRKRWARQTEDGRSLAGRKVSGGLPRSRLCMTGCLDSTIRCRTRSPNGRVIRANHRSRFANCSAKPTALKARRVFSVHRFEIETRWQFVAQSSPEPGSAFIYGPSHLQIFSELLRRKLRGRSVISYFETHVAEPAWTA